MNYITQNDDSIFVNRLLIGSILNNDELINDESSTYRFVNWIEKKKEMSSLSL